MLRITCAPLPKDHCVQIPWEYMFVDRGPYSLNVKRVKWLLFKRVKKRKDHSNQVKITLKMSENHSKASENHSEESENHSKRVTFTFWGAHWGTALLFFPSHFHPSSMWEVTRVNIFVSTQCTIHTYGAHFIVPFFPNSGNSKPF